jgi:transcriptional regulator with XRE-family HTH domain
MSTKTIYTREYRILLRILRSKRQQKRISQEDLAKKLGVPQSFISKIERGERRIDVIDLFRYCEVLNIELVQFIKELIKEIKIGKKEE